MVVTCLGCMVPTFNQFPFFSHPEVRAHQRGAADPAEPAEESEDSVGMLVFL